MTSTTGVSMVSEIGFFTEYELPNIGTGIQPKMLVSEFENTVEAFQYISVIVSDDVNASFADGIAQ